MTKISPTCMLSFASKGQTLATIRPALEAQGLRLCDQILFRVADWREKPAKLVDDVCARFEGAPLAVRSSSLHEDSWNTSNAGHFTTMIDIPSEPAQVRDAVEAVIASYEQASPDDEVLIQPMVRNVMVSGVVLTRDLTTGGPYLVANYDDESGFTHTVTSGLHGTTVFVHRDTPDGDVPPEIRPLVVAARCIEEVVDHDALDIELCIDAAGDVYVLQVRPLVEQQGWTGTPADEVRRTIGDVETAVANMMAPADGFVGSRTVLGDMPDWNPAEMIGSTPRLLALSLYERQITNRAWALARQQMGYRFVDRPLMTVLAGRPYIDVRKSLNSFLPATLPDDVAAGIVDAQLSILEASPEFHDKIEFEVALTCFDFNFDNRLETLVAAGVSKEHGAQLKDAHLALTRDAVRGGAAHILDILATTEPSIYDTDGMTGEPLDVATALLDRAIANGTLPFSILARHAFIGMSFLKSLVARDIFTSGDQNNFLLSISTVANDLVDALHKVSSGALSLEAFLEDFGHLRPGTYDISSLRYDERPDVYFRDFAGSRASTVVRKSQAFRPTSAQLSEIDGMLNANGFEVDAAGLLDYIAAATAAREEAKFNFTRGISNALRLIGSWGEDIGVSRQQLANIRFEDLQQVGADTAALNDLSEAGRMQYRLGRTLRLPHLISAGTNLRVITPSEEKPNFVTDRTVAAQTVLLDQGTMQDDLDGHIIIIERADPGYDWIFSHDIAGLITLYGGTNSHMAIRCAEFDLPAAIGTGQKLYEAACAANWIEMDCGAHVMSFH